jgi:predicted nucleic-acid-binding protein
MIGVDTNVLARFFIGDDKKQTEAAWAFLKARNADDPVFVSVLVIAELVWVLRRLYEVPKDNVIEMIGVLTSSPAILIERSDLVIAAVAAAAHPKADVADAIIAAIAADAGCTSTVTFDKSAAKHIPGMELLA